MDAVTPSGASPPPGRPLRRRAGSLAAAALVLAAAAGAALLALPRIEEGLRQAARERGEVTLALAAQAIDQLVRRFDPIPELIAARPHLRGALASPGSATQVAFVNEQLRLTARAVGASDVVLVGLDGTVVAAASYREGATPIGRDVLHRPHVHSAARGRAAFFHAAGPEGEAGSFHFSAPVLDGIDVIGVVSVRIDLREIEAGWQDLRGEIALADEGGIIFMSSRPEWTFRTLAPLSEARRAEIAAARQFFPGRLRPLDAKLSPLSDGMVRIEMGAGQPGGGTGTADAGGIFLVSSAPVALPGWHAIVLEPLGPIEAQARRVLLGWAAGALALVLLLVALAQRIARRREIERSARAERDRLERRVRERTAELGAANGRLQREIAERRDAEARLKRTQEHLVQAGKLAALGKMSAALSHEINQPLAAIKSYASNAGAFLDRGREDEARENVRRIARMTDRVARISTHLRNFARRPDDALVAVDLRRAVEQALELMEPELRARGVRVAVDAPAAPLHAKGGEVRLQQVLVNILSNAVAAMGEADDPRIEIGITEADGPGGPAVEVTVRDHGPGLDPETADQLFEPFFSRRSDKRGLGLGLSISYNIVEDFGGTLDARTHPGGGAEFRIRLRPAGEGEAAAPLAVPA
ncbi:sensor histidine kinase [Hasllibacter halocynthiae]|nr:ATP-binding protein [Hasllibacter halocynthiae]